MADLIRKAGGDVSPLWRGLVAVATTIPVSPDVYATPPNTAGGSSNSGNTSGSTTPGVVIYNSGVQQSASSVKGRILTDKDKEDLYKGSLTAVALSMAKGATGT